MTKIWFLLLLIVSVTITFAQEADRKSVAVTIYNDNLAVVKDLRSFNISEGRSTIEMTDVAQMLNAATVHIGIDGEVLEQNYRYDLVSFDKILQRYIDRDIQLFNEKGEMFEGTLLSSFGGQIVLKKQDGGLLMLPSTEDYRISVTELPEGLKTRPTLIWDILAEKSGKQDVEISYHTGGMRWSAEYVAVLSDDEKTLDLNAWVSIDNQSGATYKDAKLKLVAGDVNRAKSVYVNGAIPKEARTFAMVEDAGFEEQQFFEYHIYNLQRPTTLANREQKQITLFEAGKIAVNKKYLYSNSYKHGKTHSANGKVAIVLEFNNSEENNLGMPMPKGTVRVNKSDGESIEFIGEDFIDHTPKDEDVELYIGNAFDITAEEKTSDTRKISQKVRETDFEITFKNHKDKAVSIEVVRNIGANGKIINSNVKDKKEDAYTSKFDVNVNADSEFTLKYTVRYSY